MRLKWLQPVLLFTVPSGVNRIRVRLKYGFVSVYAVSVDSVNRIRVRLKYIYNAECWNKTFVLIVLG